MTIATHTSASHTTAKGLPAWLELAIIALFSTGSIFALDWLGLPEGGLAGTLDGPITLIACVVIITVFQRLRGETWRDLGLRWPGTFKSVGLGALVVIGVFISAVAMNGLVQFLLNAALENGFERTLPDVSTIARFVLIMVIVWTTAAFAEEMVYRGFFINRFADVFGRSTLGWAAAVITPAVLFGIGHAYQGWAGMVITGSVGLVFGVWFMIAKRNLLPVIIGHGIINSFGMTILFLIGQGVIQVEGL